MTCNKLISNKSAALRLGLALAAAALLLDACAGPTRPFLDASGKVLPNSIAEQSYLSLPGAREYLLVRGRNLANPVVLFVHGGPGGSEMPLMRLFNPQLEEHLVMAYWDQRGAGKSYAPDIPTSSMNMRQFIDDMDKVVDYLRWRSGQRRIFILGHSWGSALGMLYAQRFPEKLYGYVGVGQIADNLQDEAHAYEFVLAEACRRHDEDALAQLRKIGPPPYTYSTLVVRDRLLHRYGGDIHAGISLLAIAWEALWLPEVGLGDLMRLWQALQFSQQALWPAFARLDLTKQVPAVNVPVAFILGRHDQRTWAPLAADYLKRLEAPKKRLFWLEHSAHNGPFEEPQVFRKYLLETIQDFLAERGRRAGD